MSHATAAFHQLHLLLVYAQNGTIGVGIPVEPDDETVGERSHLKVVANARHWASCRHDVSEMVKQFKHFFCRQRVRIFLFNPCHFVGQSPVHVLWRFFVDISVAVFQGVFVHPYSCGQFIAVEIFQGCFVCLLESVCLVRFHKDFERVFLISCAKLQIFFHIHSQSTINK